MAEMKTRKNDASVEDFLNKIKDEERRKDCFEIVKIMKQATKKQPKMWGSSIVGFGTYHYVYESGREGDAPLIGFSPRAEPHTVCPARLPKAGRFTEKTRQIFNRQGLFIYQEVKGCRHTGPEGTGERIGEGHKEVH